MKKMAEELIEVLNENGIKTGEILPRSIVHKRGVWHRIIVVAILNEKNEILIQQRSHNKDKNPDMWDISVTGNITVGQDSLTTAIREIKEEIGVRLDESIEWKDLRYIFSYKKQQRVNENHFDSQFYDFFILRKNGLKEKDIKMQESEVQAIRFVSINEINEMRNNNSIVERDECYQALEDYVKNIKGRA